MIQMTLLCKSIAIKMGAVSWFSEVSGSEVDVTLLPSHLVLKSCELSSREGSTAQDANLRYHEAEGAATRCHQSWILLDRAQCPHRDCQSSESRATCNGMPSENSQHLDTRLSRFEAQHRAPHEHPHSQNSCTSNCETLEAKVHVPVLLLWRFSSACVVCHKVPSSSPHSCVGCICTSVLVD